jgi:hypothetical protein
MDFSSAFKSELFRPLVTLFIPGGVAAAPFFLLVGHYAPATVVFWDDHPSTTVAVVVGCIVAAGLVLENFGSRLEELCDRQLNKNDDHGATWNAYLGLTLKDEIVGQRYLRTLLLRMKFELAMVPALICGVAGLLWLDRVKPFWPFYRGWLWFGGIAMVGYFAWESYASAKVMGATRKIVVRAAGSRRSPDVLVKAIAASDVVTGDNAGA